MSDLIDNLAMYVGMALIFILGFLMGIGAGTISGREGVHTGEYQCQTLPDNSVHCWKQAAENNQQQEQDDD